ncbi:hypothetical protein ASE40_18335 [Flavobacterium sp. Root935]|uniref:hypothetical protein n=1 Tax=Flavobacterium sp. Root935 TaxID=1736610 RepID=UPI00070D3EB1|nr:hypothetical protein [Flavobacterium sp. Root935]KRD58292.1 hypothetical protein ASE40_18335 [Flavobacterium sp. Root935]
MNWIRKTVICIALLIAGLFAYQADTASVHIIETQKTDSNFCKDITDSSAFIQPQGSYQFAANIKTNPSGILKCFESLLPLIPQHQTVTNTTVYTKIFTTQSKKVLVILYAFHFFW